MSDAHIRQLERRCEAPEDAARLLVARMRLAEHHNGWTDEVFTNDA